MTNENLKETRYWIRQTRKYYPQLKLSKKTGLVERGPNNFRNVWWHEIMESEAADVLAEAFGLPEEKRSNLRQATLTHDLIKRRQKELIEKEGNTGQLKAFAQQAQILRGEGYSQEVINLTESVGHTSLINLIKDPQAPSLELKDGLDLSILIIHYADDITKGPGIVTIDQRMSDLENRQPPYPEATMGGDIFGGRTYYQTQRAIAHIIEDKFADMLKISASEVPTFITTRIVERINSFNQNQPQQKTK